MKEPVQVLTDQFNRNVSYLRMSVTDRCDFRCVYCMAEDMTFLPRKQLLSLEEQLLVGQAFVELGVTKLRITGGEPLVRNNLTWLLERLSALTGLQELTMTTNGSQLQRHAAALKAAGVSRLNISLDSLKPNLFKQLTRTGELATVLQGIEAAQNAGFERTKLNAVILKGRNESEVLPLTQFALDNGLDISFIEEMPLGEISEHDRGLAFYSSDKIRQDIEQRHELIPTTEKTGGPSRYYRVAGYENRVGFISPHSNNFCSSCNRVRLTAEGRLLLCLGQEHSVDLREVVRAAPGDLDVLKNAIVESMKIKPLGHDFDLDSKPKIMRFMSLTGG